MWDITPVVCIFATVGAKLLAGRQRKFVCKLSNEDRVRVMSVRLSQGLWGLDDYEGVNLHETGFGA